MLIQEILQDDPTLVRTYSDSGNKLLSMSDFQEYDEAVDPVSENRQYMELTISHGTNGGQSEQLPDECYECKYYKAYHNIE